MAKRELYEALPLIRHDVDRKRDRKKRRDSRKRKKKRAVGFVSVEQHKPKQKHYLRPLAGPNGQLAFNFWGVPTR